MGKRGGGGGGGVLFEISVVELFCVKKTTRNASILTNPNKIKQILDFYNMKI